MRVRSGCLRLGIYGLGALEGGTLVTTNVETRYPWAYGFLRSAVDGVLEKILVTHSPTVTEQEVYNRLKDAVERIDEELAR